MYFYKTITNILFITFKVACDTFCLDDDGTFLEATMSLQSESLTINNVRFIEATTVPLTAGLSKCHNKKVG